MYDDVYIIVHAFAVYLISFFFRLVSGKSVQVAQRNHIIIERSPSYVRIVYIYIYV